MLPKTSKIIKQITKKGQGYKDIKLQGHEALGYKRPAGGAEHLNNVQGSKSYPPERQKG